MARRKSSYRSLIVGSVFTLFTFGASFAVIAAGKSEESVDTAAVAAVSRPEPSVSVDGPHETLTERDNDLDAAQAMIQAQQDEILALNQQLQAGLAVSRTFEVNDRDVAYPLLPPKLMMSVSTFGGALVVNYGPARDLIQVGGRIDIRADGRDCFLVLLESRIDKAKFTFGCDSPTGSLALVKASG